MNGNAQVVDVGEGWDGGGWEEMWKGRRGFVQTAA